MGMLGLMSDRSWILVGQLLFDSLAQRKSAVHLEEAVRRLTSPPNLGLRDRGSEESFRAIVIDLDIFPKECLKWFQFSRRNFAIYSTS